MNSHLASSSPSVHVYTNPSNSPVAQIDSIRSSFSHGMKQGLSSLAVSFNKGLSTPDSEVASTWSNLSDESSDNNFIHLDPSECGDGEMGVSPIPDIDKDDIEVEVATEVVEDDESLASPQMPNEKVMVTIENDVMVIKVKTNNKVYKVCLHEIKGRTITLYTLYPTKVGVITIELDGVEAAQEAKGLNTVLKLQCKGLHLTESTCPLSEFQVRFKIFLTSVVTILNVVMGNGMHHADSMLS